ncbi:flagellar hook protein FlgE [Alcanivorax sp. ZXX171]|nr:flagellar hook protein FlgE [Alcanivorax sp. ZXX171]
MGFSQALSGLNSAATNLDVVGNNIANSQTVGFKGASTQFADVYTGAMAGQGVRVAAVLQDFSNGTLESTGRNLDLAINGGGFFRFQQGEEIVYSRNGQLSLTADGYLENAQGARLTGFPAGVGTGGQPETLQVPAGAMPAVATTAVQASFQMDATADTIDRGTTPFDATDGDTYSYANTGTAYDSLGVQHTMTTYFTKTADNTWEVRVAVDGNADTTTGELVFDGNGVLDDGASTFANYGFTPGGGADPMNFGIDFDGTTQFGNGFAMDTLTQNGSAAGSLVGITFDETGNIIGNYSNEKSQVLGTIEKSNVDLTSELVDLIVAQRNYQANTQTIKVQDEVLQSAVNLR